MQASDYREPFLEGQVNYSTVQNLKKNIQSLPQDYQWLFDEFNEVNYSKPESRIKHIPYKLEKPLLNLNIHQLIVLPHKNLILAEYTDGCYYTIKYLDFVDLNTLQTIKSMELQQQLDDKIIYQVFNGVDYIFYQERYGCIRLIKFDDFEQKEEKYLIEFYMDNYEPLYNASIIDEFTIILQKGPFFILYKLDTISLNQMNPDTRIRFEIGYFNSQDYMNQISNNSNQIFIKVGKQGQTIYQMLRSDYSYNEKHRNYYIFKDLSKTCFLDDTTLQISLKLDKKLYVVRYFNLYDFLMDESFNLYQLNTDTLTLEKIHKLYKASFTNMDKIETSPTKIILLYKDQIANYTFLIFDCRTFQMLDCIKNIMSDNYHTFGIDTVNSRIYYKSAKMDFISYFRFITNYDMYYGCLIPVLRQGNQIIKNDLKDFWENFIAYNSKSEDIFHIQDLNSGFIKDISKENSDNFFSFVRNNVGIFYHPEFQEIIKQKYDDQNTYQEVQNINSEDILERKDVSQIYLNGNRKVIWSEFRQKSQQYYDFNNFFCIMLNRFNEKQYVLEISEKNTIVYYDKMTQAFTKIDMLDIVKSSNIPILALLDDELGIIVISYSDEVKIFSLDSKQRIKEISGKMDHKSIFMGNNYVQVNCDFVSNILFFKNRKVDKFIQIQYLQQSSQLETFNCYQKDINQKAYSLVKRKSKGDESGIYTMISNSFQDMFNEQYLIQPVFPAFYFDYAQKIIIDSSAIQLYIKNELEMVGNFEIDITDQLIIDYNSVIHQNNQEIVKEISSNVEKYLKFVSGFGTGFGVFQNNLVALETIAKQISMKDKQSLPILICQKMLGGDSPLDFCIKAHQQKIINLMLTIIIKYQDHIMFNKLIDKNLCELIKQQIDLQEYFESSLPTYQIVNPQYPSQHHDEQEIIVGKTLDHPKEVHDKYDELFGGKLSKSDSEDESMVSVEYQLINLPETLTRNPRELMKELSDTEKPEYFENLVIQNIINFKWNTYTKTVYQKKFYIYLIFLATFIFDIFYSAYSNKRQVKAETEENQLIVNASEVSEPNIWIKISAKVVCSAVLIYFLLHEVEQLTIQKANYFRDVWNYFDFTHIIAFVTFCVIDFTNEDSDSLILIKILVIVLSFMKLFYFLRIYDGFSFLVQMMGGVFKDLKYFISFFLIFILQFGMIFLVLFKAASIDEYNGVNKMAYFLMAFRISSGDFQLDEYQNQDDTVVIFAWIIWLIAVMTLNIVFMNFIIAVISESYERVMQKLVAESYKVKANMIVEREQLFSDKDLTKEELFPNFIIVRRPTNNDSNDAGEWQGFIKDLKYTIRTSAAKSKSEMIQNFHSSIEKIYGAIQQNQQNNNQNDSIDEKLSQLNGKLDSKVEGLEFQVKNIDSKVLGLQDDMQFIKSTLVQLLQKQNQ
ncbi:wd-40 repeat protein [Stylonychia lemnae]|uniref:Wd-40 repeat protein n=1 Tax=Stylonychia lemnae TaxID=5949 RepID=A0A077ZR51_STYLE|nr:wd-40 repeat protein [Stylonychia lemnae]|eukprot:CDW72372.1 wd-40 repeat protein [Stylonychia lemnae]